MFPDLLSDDSFRLETRRLWLRWPCARDVPQLVKYAGNIDVAKYTARIPHPYSASDGEAFVLASRRQNMLGSGLDLVLTTKSGSREVIGTISVSVNEDRSVSFGYWLGEPFWGRGLMAEALDEMIALIFHVTAAVGIRARAARENLRSIRLLKSRGFQADGRSHMIAPSRDATFDCFDFSLKQPVWQQSEQNRFQRQAMAV